MHYSGDEDIRPKDTYFLMPCLDAVIYFFLTIGVKLGDRIGVRNTVILTFALHYSSYFILIFAKNFYLFLISMVMFGIGHAISNLAVIKNCWKYFPNNTGLVYGIIVSGAGICSSIFTPLADFIVINPEKEVVDKDGFYPVKIAMRLLKYLIIVTGILGIFGALSIFFTFDKKDKVEKIGKNAPILDEKDEDEKKEKSVESEKEKEKEKEKENENEKENDKLVESEKEKEKEDEDNKGESKPNSEKNNKRLWEAFLSIKNLMFLCFCFGSFCK